MALSDIMSVMLTKKALAAATALTLVSGTAAAAAGALPETLLASSDDATGVEQDVTEPVETEDPTEPTEPVETEDPTEPTDPIETEEPTEPTDPIETEDPIVTEPEEGADEIDEVEEIEPPARTSNRSQRAHDRLSELGGGCMPQDDDCHFGQAVSERARTKGKNKHRPEEPTDPTVPDETDTPIETEPTDELELTSTKPKRAGR